MARRPLDPRKCNITIDNNALDRNGTASDLLIERLLELQRSRKLNIVVLQGVRREALHPRTPTAFREEIGSKPFTIPTEITGQELRERRQIELVLQGNAKPGKHISDARHLFEAGKYGGGYFVTNDQRILDKRIELADVLPPSLNIVTLKQLLEIFDDYESGRRV
jgi:hypothetical protein